MSEHARVHLVVTGLVQGVAFRQSTVLQAERLGLDGWVRNLPDGGVEAEAEGARPQLEALVAWCHAGPPAARVERVEATWGPATGADRGFRIVR